MFASVRQVGKHENERGKVVEAVLTAIYRAPEPDLWLLLLYSSPLYTRMNEDPSFGGHKFRYSLSLTQASSALPSKSRLKPAILGFLLSKHLSFNGADMSKAV